MLDRQGREISYLRISVTDRCDLRCRYCMPENGISWVEHREILTYEEILHLVGLFAQLGIHRIRLTGGEPLVRQDLPRLVAGIKRTPGVRWVGLTTNGILLKEQLPALLAVGVDGINLSLDTLDRQQYAAITRRDALYRALDGLNAALSAAASDRLTLKINCVPTAENAGQWVPLARIARDNERTDVRFIELMPIGLGAEFPCRTEAEVRAALETAFGPAIPCPQEHGGGPSRYVTFPGFRGRVGFISAITHQFCSGCNRVRLTATGFLKTCLQYRAGVDLRGLLRNGSEDQAILAAIEAAVQEKPAAHHFHTGRDTEDETRTMNQIGG